MRANQDIDGKGRQTTACRDRHFGLHGHAGVVALQPSPLPLPHLLPLPPASAPSTSRAREPFGSRSGGVETLVTSPALAAALHVVAKHCSDHHTLKHCWGGAHAMLLHFAEARATDEPATARAAFFSLGESLAQLPQSEHGQPQPETGAAEVRRDAAARGKLSPGLVLEQRRHPLGVIGVVFEARPDALPQIVGLALKSGNAIVLKGGREAARTNAAMTATIWMAVCEAGIQTSRR
mgnify:CR=1 FL=1